MDALSRINAANIELTDIALRRPSLDEVFLSLTNLPPPSGSGEPDESTASEPARQLLRELLRRISQHAMATVCCATE